MWGMLRLDRSVGRAVLAGVVIVWLALTGVYTLLDGIRELRQLSAGYGVVDILWYLLLTAPRRAYQVFPFASLVGAVVAIGGLAASGELVAWRSLGATRGRLAAPIIGAIGILLLLVMLIAENWATPLELHARSFRLAGITGQVSLAGPAGLWLRDGDSFVHIRYPLLDEALATDFRAISIYHLNDNAQLRGWIKAERALHSDGQWQLIKGQHMLLDDDGIEQRDFQDLQWPSQLSAGTLGNTVLRPSLLSISALKQLMSYFQANELDDGHYRAALWRRYYYPAIAFAAVWLGLPFVLHLHGKESRARALAVALAVGMAWYVLERLVQGLVLALRWPPAWGGLIPIIIAFIVGLILLRRQRV